MTSAVGDLGQPLDHGVELGCAEAYPPRLSVASELAGDDTAALLVDRDPVAVPPDARIDVEIRLPVPGAVRVVPEADRHARHRLGDHQLAELAHHRRAVARTRLDLGAEAAAGDHAGPHREQRRRADEAGAHVGAAGQRLELQGAAHVLVERPALGGARGVEEGVHQELVAHARHSSHDHLAHAKRSQVIGHALDEIVSVLRFNEAEEP